MTYVVSDRKPHCQTDENNENVRHEPEAYPSRLTWNHLRVALLLDEEELRVAMNVDGED